MSISNGEQLSFPAVLYRGGTSKGLFFAKNVLPADASERDRVLLRALGGGDRFGSEIDGVGGATSSTSKSVVVSPSERPGFDLDYLFAQVGVRDPAVDWKGSCGNLAAAVGPFALEEGMVPATTGVTTLRIWQANTHKEIVSHVPTRGGFVVTEGEFYLDGVPYPSAAIPVDFMDPTGSVTGKLFPTDNLVDEVEVDGRGVRMSMVDAGNPCVFVGSGEVGMRGVEPASQLNADSGLLVRLETLRAEASVRMGIANTAHEATRTFPATPRIGVVGYPASYRTSSGDAVDVGDVDLVVRMLSMGRAHHALPVTGGIALAVAARIPGTVPGELCRNDTAPSVRIGHPSGTVRFEAVVERFGGSWRAHRVTVLRSARRLMEGHVLVPPANSTTRVHSC